MHESKTTAVNLKESAEKCDRPSAGTCCREKFWEEKTAEEKIEAMACVIESLARELEHCSDQHEDLRHHSHSNQGAILVPLNTGAVKLISGTYFHRNPLRREKERTSPYSLAFLRLLV